MQTTHKKRLFGVLFVLLGVSLSVGLVLYALRQDISLYVTPSQLLRQQTPPSRLLRLGGLVKPSSVHYGQGLKVLFVVTDGSHAVTVSYTGVLPTLFRAGQGVVAQGRLTAQGVFLANQLLAKHDATYKPPAVRGEGSLDS